MQVNKIYWLLYQCLWSDYLTEAKISKDVRMIYNYVPTIIDIDKNLILKGMTVKGTEEQKQTGNELIKTTVDLIIEANDFSWVKDEIIPKQLIDGIAWIDITRTPDDKIILSPLGLDNVSNVTYNAQGDIITAKIKIGKDEKEYYIDAEGKKFTKIKPDGGEEKNIPNVYDFVPLVEITGTKNTKDKNIARVQGIEDILNTLNENEADIRKIIKLHGDPYLVADQPIDKAKLAEMDNNRQPGELRSLGNVKGQLRYMEMQGNVLNTTVQKNQNLDDKIATDYPEILLMKVAQGAGYTGEALSKKLIPLIAVLNGYRENFKKAMEKVFRYSLTMLGKVNETAVISFDAIFDEDFTEKFTVLSTAFKDGAISRETYTKFVCEYLGIDSEAETEKINSQDVYDNQLDKEV